MINGTPSETQEVWLVDEIHSGGAGENMAEMHSLPRKVTTEWNNTRELKQYELESLSVNSTSCHYDD